MITAQVWVPEQAPLHPVKTEPAAGIAVSVTVVPLAIPAEHVAPQLIPPTLLVTVPVPLPCLVTTNCGLTPVPDKLTVWAGATESLKVSVPARAPVADALNVTVTVQKAFAATEFPQSLVWLKSVAPAVTAIEVIVSGTFPVFIRLTASVGGTPTGWFPNGMLVADSTAVGAYEPKNSTMPVAIAE